MSNANPLEAECPVAEHVNCSFDGINHMENMTAPIEAQEAKKPTGVGFYTPMDIAPGEYQIGADPEVTQGDELDNQRVRGYRVLDEGSNPRMSDFPKHKCHSLCRPESAEHFILSKYPAGEPTAVMEINDESDEVKAILDEYSGACRTADTGHETMQDWREMEAAAYKSARARLIGWRTNTATRMAVEARKEQLLDLNDWLLMRGWDLREVAARQLKEYIKIQLDILQAQLKEEPNNGS